jgi:predicted nucleic acid-binding protein
LTDCSVWNYARENNFTLLTGDKKLRNIAIESGVNVCGILFLFDEMVAQGIINVNVAIDKLTELYRNNTRLPKKEIDKRLELWNFFIPLE